jgi:hypothetical protein
LISAFHGIIYYVSDVEDVWILDGESRTPVEARLYKDITQSDMQASGMLWKKQLKRLSDLARKENLPEHLLPQHSHWTWLNKGNAEPDICRRFAIECDGQWQGMMVLIVGSTNHIAKMKEQKHQRAVYVDYVQTAPLCWTEFLALLNMKPRFKGIGQLLIASAIELSRESGYNGIISLHSLPQAEGFYGETCRMVTLGPDYDKQELRYFEMTKEIADRFTKAD